MNSASANLMESAAGVFRRPFGGVLRIECTDDGSSVWIDGRGTAVKVSEAAPPDVSSRFCLWRGEAHLLVSVLAGQRRLETAYMAGQVRISGDMAVMARLEFGDA